ncbi:YjbF family lipoprotein [Sulfitobacter sp. S223]|uniref:YjbF family lipoprotein n=1 Tax=Sulfitobacter sp. S223 TaxID=2867023 RepID=UPI0021A3C653|nr:YjbF family lipoprotein [Sulfitobacter sp. S223]UWR26529.1 YjbF family lipoprotein [Sulfitobacter sp. S223]
MINVVRRLTGAVLVSSLLLGCSYSSRNDEQPSSVDQLRAVGAQILSSRRAGPPAKTEVTADILSKITVPVVQINPEVFGGSDFLTRATSRRDSGLGTVEVWNSTDNAQIILRNGVLVGTRGIGSDIIAADADMTIRALQAGATTSGTRRYTISDGDVTTTDYVFSCNVRNMGGERISVANQLFDTRHMREDCVGGPQQAVRLSNDYWVQPGSGLVRKSRQWVSPSAGFFEIIVIRN